jgi:molecular chaperone DnaK
MATFVGIDLGTTNTSIATFDGRVVEVKKSLGGVIGQSETTPSAIFIDENQQMYIGSEAYQQISIRPQDVARAWKRTLGTGAPIEFSAAAKSVTSEWCSSELLKRVFGYLPPAVRQDKTTSVVITVPAAFGQVKNEATLKAASEAGIPNAKLMPEPVAACLAVMHKDRSDKTFLVYDLGGGTFDASVASFKKGTGSIIAQGGIESSGGRDWDFEILNKVIIPWICDNYAIDEDDLNDETIKNQLAKKAEEAKIELASRYAQDADEDLQVQIRMPVGDIKVDGKRLTDNDGQEIGLNVPFKKSLMDELVANYIDSTIQACQQVFADNNVDPKTINYVVFIGGPTLYSPLRKRVCQELAIEEYPSEIDPMTAVAKGAAIYAESLDWSAGGTKPTKQQRTSKSEADSAFPLAVEFEKRVTAKKAKVILTLDAAKFESVAVEVKNATFSTGVMNITYSKEVAVTLAEDGLNTFEIIVTAPGRAEPFSKTIEITRGVEFTGLTSARAIFVEVWDSNSGRSMAENVVKVGERLPKTGTFRARANKELKFGVPGAFNLRVYEGQVEDVVDDNTFIGALELASSMLDKYDVVAKGDELICDFTLNDDLNLSLTVSVPSIGSSFDLKLDGEAIKNPRDDWQELAQGGRSLKLRIQMYVQNKPNEQLESLLSIIQDAVNVIETSLVDEEVQTAVEKIRQARKTFWEARKADIPDRLKKRWQAAEDYFNTNFKGRVKASATPAERKRFEQESQKALAATQVPDAVKFEQHLELMWDVCRDVIWRSEWWIELKLKEAAEEGSGSAKALAEKGLEQFEQGEVDEASNILANLMRQGSSKNQAGNAEKDIVHKDPGKN